MPLQPVQVDLDARPQLHADHVSRPPVFDPKYLGGVLDDPLGEQEPDGQLGIMAGQKVCIVTEIPRRTRRPS